MVKTMRVMLILLICLALASCSMFQQRKKPDYQEGKFVVSYPLDGDIITDEEGDQYYVVTSNEFIKLLKKVKEQQEQTMIVEVTHKEIREVKSSE